MVEELGSEPGPALRELEAAILAHSPDLAPPALPYVPASDHGAAVAPDAVGGAAAIDASPLSPGGERGVGPVIRLVLAEDNYLVREGMRRLLETRPELELVASCGDLESLLEAVEAERPDVVLTDIRMPPDRLDEGIRAAQRLRETSPGVGVVVLSQYAEPGYALALLEGGSERRAYLLKERVDDLEQLVSAIRAVAAGGSVIDPKVVESLVAAKSSSDRSALSELTPREREVLREMAEGKNNAAIAEALVITERSVEKYVHAIFSKLGLAWEEKAHRRVKAVLLFLADNEG